MTCRWNGSSGNTSTTSPPSRSPTSTVRGTSSRMAAHLIYLKSRRLLPPEQRPTGSEDGHRGGRPALGTHPAARRVQEVQGRRRASPGGRDDAAGPFRPPAGPAARTGREGLAGSHGAGRRERVRPAQRVPEDAAPVRAAATPKRGTPDTVIFEENFHRGRQDRAAARAGGAGAGALAGVHGIVCRDGLAGGDWWSRSWRCSNWCGSNSCACCSARRSMKS